jgi:ABC-type methionine transport system permease subunit
LDDSSGYLGMYFLPENFFDLFIGTGHNTNYSDVGYIQIIFMGGLFLLALIVFFYLYLYFAAKKSIYKIRKIKKTYSWELVVLDYMVFILLVIMLLSNFKNLYFLTRGYHELIVIISVSTFGFLTQTDKSNLGV